MVKLAILVVEDEPPVRDAVERDLAPFASVGRIEPAESVDDAWEALNEIVDDGDRLALVVTDHRLPGRTGVDFLIELSGDERFAHVRKVLLTGQADHDDTIRAINDGHLHHYFAKPWDAEELRTEIRTQLTEFVLSTKLDPLPHLQVLDAPRVMGVVGRRFD